MHSRLVNGSFVILILALAWRPVRAAEVVNESAREIPVAYDVDVVVVGGSTGAVAAAVAAAEEGARVFLAAPHPYLGEDMTATLQLWLEPGEAPTSPLARRIYDDEVVQAAEPNRLKFTYQADTPSADMHRDTTPPSRLTDGKWSSASQESVQYDHDTSLVADLGSVQDLTRVRVMFFRRRESSSAGSGFDVQNATIHTSNDKQKWNRVEVIENTQPFQDAGTLSLPLEVQARYVKIDLKIAAPSTRMLLGEIEILGPEQAEPENGPPLPAPPRPMHVKKVLDDALLQAGVQYLYSCFATDVIRDADGRLGGIVMANRAGRQAVIARQVIDATPTATVARMAGVEMRGAVPESRSLRRVVIGGKPRSDSIVSVRQPCAPYSILFPNATAATGGVYPVFEYTMELPLDDSYASLMKADQVARNRTYDPDQQYTSDVLFQLPETAIRSAAAAHSGSVDQLALSLFQPAGEDRLYVLSGYADVPRTLAATLIRPVNLIQYGERIGRAAAAKASQLPAPEGVRLVGEVGAQPVAEGDVRELLQGTRPVGDYATIAQDARAIPVLGTYDVVVIGGGTGGAPAGIGAARQGAKTLVVEYLYGLGGVGTEGAIASYYWGNRVGFHRHGTRRRHEVGRGTEEGVVSPGTA